VPPNHRQHWLAHPPERRWTLRSALRRVSPWTWFGLVLLAGAGSAVWRVRHSPEAKRAQREAARADSLALLDGLEDSVMLPITDVLVAENAFAGRHGHIPMTRQEYASGGLDTTRLAEQGPNVLQYHVSAGSDTLGVVFRPGGIGRGAYTLRASRLGLVGCGWESRESHKAQCGYIEAGPVMLGSLISRMAALLRPHEPWWPLPRPAEADSRD
jgi:hypothetical protein